MFAWRDGTRELVAGDGARLEMDPHQWYGAAELTGDLDDVVPAELHVPMPDRAVTFRPMGVPERASLAFVRWAGTRPGLTTMIAICAVLALLSLLGSHVLVGSVFVALGLVIGAQLYRLANTWPAETDPDLDGSVA